jgi:hypothetical protein
MLELRKRDRLSSPLARVMANTTPQGTCLVFTGHLNVSGYGYMKVNQKNRRVHKVVYEEVFGKVPAGLVLDHLCRNRGCCNPSHLEVVTVKENLLRGQSIQAQNARKTHCKNGHPLTGTNLVVRLKGRGCRICINAYARDWKAARER